jgi:hypothetical protein
MVRFLSAVAILVAAVSTTNAFSVERRGFLAKVGSTIAGAAVLATNAEQAMAAAYKTGPASPFNGDFDDPNHPGCLRQVKVVGAPLGINGKRSPYPVIEVVGYDGKGDGSMCSDRPTRADLWKIQGKMKNNNEAVIDFSPKGGPSNLLATWDSNGIVFPDGNKWTKIPEGTPARRPEDMRTLKSE